MILKKIQYIVNRTSLSLASSIAGWLAYSALIVCMEQDCIIKRSRKDAPDEIDVYSYRVLSKAKLNINQYLHNCIENNNNNSNMTQSTYPVIKNKKNFLIRKGQELRI